jgi:hypothetical protein
VITVRRLLLTLVLLFLAPGLAVALTAQDRRDFATIVGGLGSAPINWNDDFLHPLAAKPGAPRKAMVLLAKRFSKADLVDLISSQANSAVLRNNLDVGRHRLLKELLAEGIRLGNAELLAKSTSKNQYPLIQNLLTVNSGGAGNVDRDIDLTAYVGATPTTGDVIRENAFFEGLKQAAKNRGMKVTITQGGLTLDGLETTIFRGLNNPPDARFAVDLKAHVRQYRRAIQAQRADPEAYKGAGWKKEVFRRGTQAASHIQQYGVAGGKIDYSANLTAEKLKTITYGAQIPHNMDELKAVFRGTADVGLQRWELSSHIINNSLQTRQHRQHGESDPTKGVLKYTARTLDSLAAFFDLPPWRVMNNQARLDLIGKLFPGYSDAKLRKIKESLTIAVWISENKGKPMPNKFTRSGLSGERRHLRIAEIFQHRAAAFTAGEMARTMLYPPAFNLSNIRFSDAERLKFDKLSYKDKMTYMVKRNDTYGKVVAHESMENLLMSMVELRQLDYRYTEVIDPANGRKTGQVKETLMPVQRGLDTILMMRDNATPETRPLLNLAAQYALIYSQSRTAPSADIAKKNINDLYRIRGQMEKLIGSRPPGQQLISQMAKMLPADFVEKSETGGKSPLGDLRLELNDRFRQHISDAFPTMRQEFEGFKQEWNRMGPKNYVRRRLAEEAMDIGNVADGLQLVEMYQHGASANDYAWFFTTNVLGRFHWSISPFIQAAQTHSAEDLKMLGKNIFFLSAARMMPGMGQVKAFFDIGQGVANVTTGYVITGKNAQTIAEVYTGDRLGRVDKKLAGVGTVASARRDSFNILSESDLRTIRPPGAKVDIRVVDGAKVYKRLFQKWTGRKFNHLPRRFAKQKTGSSAFLKAHDVLAQLVVRQAEKKGPAWVSQYGRFTFSPNEREYDAAIKVFYPLLKAECRKEVRAILSAGSVRTYRSWADKKDVIEEGLVGALTNDVFTGFMAGWENYLTAQIMARREIEQTAMNLDLAVIAKQLHNSTFKQTSANITSKGKGLRFDVAVSGARTGLTIKDAAGKMQQVYDGGMDIAFYPKLVWPNRPKSFFGGDVIVKVVDEHLTPVKLKKVKDSKENLFRNDLTFIAINGSGEELARSKRSLYVLAPSFKVEFGLHQEYNEGEPISFHIQIQGGKPPFTVSGSVQGNIQETDHSSKTENSNALASAKRWDKQFDYTPEHATGQQTVAIKVRDADGVEVDVSGIFLIQSRTNSSEWDGWWLFDQYGYNGSNSRRGLKRVEIKNGHFKGVFTLRYDDIDLEAEGGNIEGMVNIKGDITAMLRIWRNEIRGTDEHVVVEKTMVECQITGKASNGEEKVFLGESICQYKTIRSDGSATNEIPTEVTDWTARPTEKGDEENLW